MSDKGTPIMMGNTKPMVITGVVKVKIAKPDFDITKHEWSSKFNMDLSADDQTVHFEDVTTNVGCVLMLTKKDTIALARHFKLKPEDLT